MHTQDAADVCHTAALKPRSAMKSLESCGVCLLTDTHWHSIHSSDLAPGDTLGNDMQSKVVHDAVEPACPTAASTTGGLHKALH